jgi:hypothetical protein
MKSFQIPNAIRLRDQITQAEGELVTFEQFAHSAWLNDSLWADPKSNLERLLLVLSQIKKPPMEWAELEDADWDLLASIVRKPVKQPPLVLVQLRPFERAVLDATTRTP